MQEEIRFENFVGLITAIDKEIQRIKTAELARFGLRASDLMIVYNLDKHPEGPSAADLARYAEIDRAAVSRSLVRLSQQGFVKLGAAAPDAPRYRTPVYLTEKGTAAMTEVDALIRNIVQSAGGALEDEQRQAMYNALASVLEQLKNTSR